MARASPFFRRLTAKNFEKKVQKGKKSSFVKFLAPWYALLLPARSSLSGTHGQLLAPPPRTGEATAKR